MDDQEDDAKMIADVRRFTERILTPIVQRLRVGPMTPSRLEVAQLARDVTSQTYDLLDAMHTDSVLAETTIEDDAMTTIEPERRRAMRHESMTPDDEEMIAEIRELTGWGGSATRAFVAHLDALPSMLRRRGFCMRRFADLAEKNQDVIPLSALRMQNHYSTERVKWLGDTSYERIDYEPQRVTEPEYCSPKNQVALAVWTVYCQTRSAQARERSAEQLRRQMSAA